MKKSMVVIIALLVLFTGCFKDEAKKDSSAARGKFMAILDDLKGAETNTKRVAGQTQEGVFITVGTEIKFYPLEYVLFTMTQTEKFKLADELDAASLVATNKAYLVFGGKALHFNDLMAGKNFNTPNLPSANTLIPPNTPVRDVEANKGINADGTPLTVGVAKIVLTADKTSIAADNSTAATLTATVYDQNNAVLTGQTITYYVAGTTALASNAFKTGTEGTYNLTAKVGTVTSNVVTITATKVTTPTFTISDATNIPANSAFKVKVSGAGFSAAVLGFEVRVKYDPTKLAIDGATATDAVTALGGFAKGLLIVKEDTKGEIIIAPALMSGGAIPNGDLAEIGFVAKNVNTAITFGTVSVPNVTSVVTTDTGVVTVQGIVQTPTSIKLTVDKTSINADGSDTATLTGTVLDQTGAPIAGQTVTYYQGNTVVGNTFKTGTEGTYTFTAKSGALTSNTVTVTANKIIVTTPTFTISDATNIPANSAFKVKVSGAGFSAAVLGFEVRVKYDPTKLAIDGATATDAVTALGGFAKGLLIVKEDTKGEIIIAPALMSGGAIPNGDLAEIGFVAKNANTAITFGTVSVPNLTSVVTTDTGVVTVQGIVQTPTSVKLTVDKTSINADGADTATLTGTVLDQTGAPIAGQTVTYYQGNTVVGNTFKTGTEGTYTFTAKSGALTSNTVTVTATKIIVTTPTFTLSDANVDANSKFTITLAGAGFANPLSGFEVKIKYNPAQLAIDGATATDAVTALGGFAKALLIVKEDVAGEILIAPALLSGATATLNSNLATIAFVAKNANTSVSIMSTSVPTVTGITSTDLGVVTVKGVVQTPTSVKLTVDKTTINADNSDTATLTATVLDQTGAPIVGQPVTYYQGTTVVGNTFKTGTTGTYTFTAKSGNLPVSGAVTVNAVPVSTTKKLEISDATATANSTGEFTISATDITEKVSGFEVTLSYDSALMSIGASDVTLAGAFASSSPIVTPGTGKVTISAALFGAAQTMTGTIAKVKFSAKAEGSATVAFSSLKVINEPGTGEVSSVGSADKGTITISKEVVVIITPTGENNPSKYYATNPTFGKNKTITVDGNQSDWSNDMIIAQGVANDDPRIFKGPHEGPVFDLYALYAAWDDTNLYLMWQYTNVTDVTAPEQGYPISDNGKPWNSNMPVAIAFSVDPSRGGTGLESGKTTSVWGMPITFTNQKVDTIAVFSTKYGVNGGSAIFKTNDNKEFQPHVRDAKGAITTRSPYEFLMSENKGIFYKPGDTFLPTAMYGINNNGYKGYVPADLAKEAQYIDFLKTTHSKAQDTFYEMSIPLTILGTTKADIESKGIGCMMISTFGVSAIDTLPHDAATLDNATKDYSADTSTSQEKEDKDVFTAPFARIGK